VRCGADGIAVLRGIVQAEDPEAMARRYVAAIGSARSEARVIAPDLPRPTLARGGASVSMRAGD
jgi:pyridoxal biosynthesis lyase PdxS